jgi:Family of unknown function (DUF6187)
MPEARSEAASGVPERPTHLHETADTRFSMPAVDDPPGVETGVMLMGFDVERLLTGLGLAALGDDPALVALAVDQLRHGVTPQVSEAAAIDAGLRLWRCARPELEGAGRRVTFSGAPRQAWARAWRVVAAAVDGPGDLGPSTRAYLTACWLRRVEVDRYGDLHSSGQLAAGPPEAEPGQ